MSDIISRIILDDEILVRLIFNGHFKRKKTIHLDNIESQRVFVDTRGNTVSLLRERYHNENDCLNRGQNINIDIAGFVIFKKEHFDSSKKEHIEQNNNSFEADIVSSPLDENHNIIDDAIDVYTDTPICPGHADLLYINPGNFEDEDANTAMRRFSRVLFKNSKIVLLNELEFLEENIFPITFKNSLTH